MMTFNEIVAYLRDRFLILKLQREIIQIKAERYNHLAETIVGLRRAITTQERAAEELLKQLEERNIQIDKLKEEYSALQARGAGDTDASVRSELFRMFRGAQPALTQLPTMRRAVESGAEISAEDVLSLFRPVEEAFADLGFEPIGTAGQELPYDPKRHTVVGRNASQTKPDDLIRVRYIGYMYESEVVCKAQVTFVEQKTQEAYEQNRD